MRVKELIAILTLADPEAEVFSEFEGDFSTVTANDVRVGGVTFADTGRIYGPDWSRDTHPWIVEGKSNIGAVTVIRKCQGVLLWAGQSSDEWPQRLDGLPTEER